MSGNTTPVTPVCTIDATGIHVPAFEDCLTYFQQVFQNVYGSDIYLGNDSQDGQLVGIIAAALNDVNSMCFAAYSSYSPATALGAGLSSVVKINGIRREIATNSTAIVTLVGQAGKTITNGVVKDSNQNSWVLPAVVNIPPSGTIDVTATAVTQGALAAGANTITTIATPQRGWQSVTNALAANQGQPVELDSALRQRQAQSTMLPSMTVMDGIIGALVDLDGVTQCVGYDNDSNGPDNNGIPAHTIALVVEGGDAQSIASVIFTKKAPGAGTVGNVTESVIDAYGNSHAVSFYTPTQVPISVVISIKALTGYTDIIGQEIIDSIVAAISALLIGQSVQYTRLYIPALLAGPYGIAANASDSTTYELIAVQISRGAAPPAGQDVAIAFNESATCTTTNVTLNVS